MISMLLKRTVLRQQAGSEASTRPGRPRETLFFAETWILGSAVINKIQVDVYSGAPWEFDTESVCVLHTLVIAPQAAGRGYGRAFVAFYERWAKEHDLPELRIDTNARNAAARALYRKLGYKEIAVVPTTFNGIPGVDLVLLEKNLNAFRPA